MKPCLKCGKLTRSGSYHPRCDPRSTYASKEWRTLSTSVLSRWISIHGFLCAGAPEMGHAPHRSSDLTVDHIDRDTTNNEASNLRVLCRKANSERIRR